MNDVEQKICEFEKRNKEIEKKIDKWEIISYLFEARYCLLSTIVDKIINVIIFFAVFMANFSVMVTFGFDETTLALFLPPAVLYFSIFVSLGIFAKRKYKHYKKLHEDLNAEVNGAIDDYYEKRCAETGIQNGFICFDNGLAVGGMGSIVYAKLPDNYGRMKVYFKDNIYDRTEVLLYHNPEKYLLNENIASLEFNDNFLVLADKGTKHESLAYLSPATQLNLLKKCINYNFTSFVDLRKEYDTSKLFEIYDDQLVVNLKYKIADGGRMHVDLLDYSGLLNKDIRRSFNMVDMYCKTFPPIALEIATIFDEKVGFLRGNAYC